MLIAIKVIICKAIAMLPRSITASIDKIAKTVIGKDWALYSTLLGHWAEIVGEEFAKNSTPIKVSFPKGKPAEEKWAQGNRSDGVLHVKLPQGLVMDFTYRSEQIRSRISDFFGYPAIERIVFEPFYASDDEGKKHRKNKTANPAIEKEIAIATQDIEAEELRQALKNLGNAIASDKITGDI